MKDQLISFKTAKIAKEKGFDIFTSFMNFYNSNNKFEERLHENLDEDSNSDFCPGFIINNPAMYDNKYYPTEVYYSAPTQSLLQKWLREVHTIDIAIKHATYYRYLLHGSYYPDNPNYCGGFKTYEEALEQGLIEALKLIKI